MDAVVNKLAGLRLKIIHDFISKWQTGSDVVHVIHNDRQNDGLFKRYSASKYYQIFNFISDLKMTPNAGDFYLLAREAINALRELPERVRFIKRLFTWIGLSTAKVHYRRLKRTQDQSKFNLKQLLKFYLDGEINSSSMPFWVWSVVGMIMTIPAIVLMFHVIIKTLLIGVDVPGHASIVLIFLFIGGIHFITLGFIRERVGRIFKEVKSRSIYIIEETIFAQVKTRD